MALTLFLFAPISSTIGGQIPVPERLATLETQMEDMKEVKALVMRNTEKINVMAGVGTGAFVTLTILDILQLLASRRKVSRRDSD